MYVLYGENRYYSVVYFSTTLLCSKHRAGGNGTASTAMAVPDFEGKKWCRLDSNLRMRYRVASPSGSP